jgi:homogentisate 1,2-dioxygenase
VKHTPFEDYKTQALHEDFTQMLAHPTQLRWSPFDLKLGDGKDFVDGLKTISGGGNPSTKSGLAIHIYVATKDMHRRAFYNSDGDMLIGMCFSRLGDSQRKIFTWT